MKVSIWVADITPATIDAGNIDGCVQFVTPALYPSSVSDLILDGDDVILKVHEGCPP